MWTTFDYALFFLSLPAPIYIAVLLLKRRESAQYLALAFYAFTTAMASIGGFAVMRVFGFTSLAYIYYYYYTESFLAVLLFLVLMSFFRQLFEDMGAGLYVRIGGILLLGGTAFVSFLIIQGSRDHMTSRFVVELGRNLNFVGVVLVYLLWIAIMKLHETRTRMVQLVLALGIYFSTYALCYGLRPAHPDWQILRTMPALVSVWLFFSWAYTFTKIPEEARLATLRVAAFRTR
jgi:hypothetical protein